MKFWFIVNAGLCKKFFFAYIIKLEHQFQVKIKLRLNVEQSLESFVSSI